MRRRDIRVKRESLGQTRIERYKDFGGLIKMHRRRQVRKQFVRNILTLLAVLFLIALIIYGSLKLRKSDTKEVEVQSQVYIEKVIDYPEGIL